MSEEVKTTDIVPLDVANSDKKAYEIAAMILAEQDVDKVKDLTALFNLHAQKRNVVRVMKLNGLLDSVTDSIVDRFAKQPHNFSNDDLLRYMQVTEQAIDRANKNLNLVEETKPIQYQQNNQVNINIGANLDRESRQRVADVIYAFLEKSRLEATNTVAEQGDVFEDESEDN